MNPLQIFLAENWTAYMPLVPLLTKVSNDLQQWNNESFHNIFRAKRTIMARIKGIQASLALARNSSLLKLESRLRRELDLILQHEELLWYQKARVSWIQDGDRNTSFFHLRTIVRRWKNRITSLKNNEDKWVHDPQEVKNLLVGYFVELFTDDDTLGDNNLPMGVCTELSSEDWNSLTRPFTKADVDMAINSMGSLKAPGPDGFQALFYQKNWALVAPKVYEMVLDVLAGRGLPPFAQ